MKVWLYAILFILLVGSCWGSRVEYSFEAEDLQGLGQAEFINHGGYITNNIGKTCDNLDVNPATYSIDLPDGMYAMILYYSNPGPSNSPKSKAFKYSPVPPTKKGVC